MTTLNSNESATTSIAVGKRLAVATDAAGSALVQRYRGHNDLLDTTPIGNGAVLTLGDYVEDMQVKVTCLTGTVSLTESQSTDPRGLSASTDELNEYAVFLDIADGSAEASYFVLCPHAGTIKSISTVIDGAVSTADITITSYNGETGITDGVITITSSLSAAGDIDTQLPSAGNVVAAGQAIKFTVTGGGSGGSPRIHLAMVITR
jgi:hypothetical protein